MAQQVKEATASYEKAKADLDENETFAHLNAMELKIRHQEANVYHLKEGKGRRSTRSLSSIDGSYFNQIC